MSNINRGRLMKNMPYLSGHLNKNLEQWKGKKWYHQRFDGSPYLIHYIAEAEIRKEQRKGNGHNDVHYCFFEEGKADWYILMDEIERIYKDVIARGKKNPRISKDLIKAWKADEAKFYNKCREIGTLDLSKLDKSALQELHDDFVETALRRNSSSSIIDGFALGTDEMVSEQIKKVYEQSSLKTEIRFSEVFSTLTAPVHLSFINDAEVALLKIAVLVKKNPGQKRTLLEEHQKKCFWIRNNYVDAYVLNVEYFTEEVEKLLNLSVDINLHIKKIEETPYVNKQKKKELMAKLDLPQELKLLITISEDFTYWQDERKKATFWTAHYATLLLDEIGKRVSIASNLLKYASPREISKIFQQPLAKGLLEQRKQNSVFYWDQQGHDCVVGTEANMIKEAILGTTDLSDVDDFRGLSACTGKAIGKVKIVKSAKEIDKVNQGDILVAVMTRPDYVPAMKKAAAIVTDEGGVTCHAAIVSRELGIPCIIGTKIATKVLKDNQQVEVNANHGWVRIVKR